MSARRNTDRRWSHWMTLAGLLAALVLVVGPRRAVAQRVGGSIGVSLTVLQPAGTRAVEVTRFSVARDGTASLRTTAPTTAPVSQLVMTRISSSANGFVSTMQAPALLRGDGAADVAERELSYQLNVGRSSATGAPRDVRLRVEFLTVAGT
jgi:hypothetical protein